MEILQVRKGQETDVADALARAFENDPACRYVFPEHKRRLRGMKWVFTCWVRLFAARGTAYTTSGMDGAALWSDPDTGHHIGLWEQIRAGFLLAPFLMTPAEQMRGLKLHLDAVARTQRHIQGPYWALDTLGVAPELHGQGVACNLLKVIFEKADSTSVPCYVITHNTDNVSFYERFGFNVVEASVLKGTDMVVTSLQRLSR